MVLGRVRIDMVLNDVEEVMEEEEEEEGYYYHEVCLMNI